MLRIASIVLFILIPLMSVMLVFMKHFTFTRSTTPPRNKVGMQCPTLRKFLGASIQ